MKNTFWAALLLLQIWPIFALDAGSNFNVEIHRRMINYFTSVLDKGEIIDTALFDLKGNQLEIKIVMKMMNVPGLDRLVPRYRPGEIFKAPDARSEDKPTLAQAQDFVIGVQTLLGFSMVNGKANAARLSFQSPTVCAYFRQDWKAYLDLIKNRGALGAALDALNQKYSSLNHKKDALLKSGKAEEALKIQVELSKVRTELSQTRDNIHSLDKAITYFSSGSHLATLPNDEAIRMVWQKFQKMDLLNKYLDVKLENIKDRAGTLLLSNLGKVLAPFVPGIVFTKIAVLKDEIAGSTALSIQGQVQRKESK